MVQSLSRQQELTQKCQSASLSRETMLTENKRKGLGWLLVSDTQGCFTKKFPEIHEVGFDHLNADLPFSLNASSSKLELQVSRRPYCFILDTVKRGFGVEFGTLLVILRIILYIFGI